ncbi:pseudouridine synthase [Desulfuromonas versatilis]|uniref:pseudouridine synthase n=1 Tax=Desulfuromonas versatilis TaxID=2802975 RepID=UPI001C84CEC5|nr:pseudouridine synthase [Desulfuromonas versatilis]
MKQRLQKLIAAAGLASRREAERWIDERRVSVNGQLASLGDTADPQLDRIEVDGRPLEFAEKKLYLLLNKPVGYVTTARDPQGRPTVMDLVKELSGRVFPVGRLDLTTDGLLLMTNDGELANRLAHPRHQVEKTYLVRVRGMLSAQASRSLETGVRLEDGMTAPARVGRVRASGSHTWFEISLREGRNRQVRRMCEAVGCPVSRLRRIRIGFLEIGTLQPGKFRMLTAEEVGKLKKM